jgi:glutamate-ammonia-ligase adenylyltransferase
VRALADAYRFLRHLENRIQAHADEQIHALPQDDLGWQRLALAMGCGDRSTLEREIDTQRLAASARFASVMLGPERAENAETTPLTGVWDGSSSPRRRASVSRAWIHAAGRGADRAARPARRLDLRAPRPAWPAASGCTDAATALGDV